MGVHGLYKAITPGFAERFDSAVAGKKTRGHLPTCVGLSIVGTAATS